MQSFDHSDPFFSSTYFGEKEREQRKRKYKEYQRKKEALGKQIHLFRLDIQIRKLQQSQITTEILPGKLISIELSVPLTHFFTAEKMTPGHIYTIALENRTMKKQVYLKGVCTWTKKIQRNFGIKNRQSFDYRNEIYLLFDDAQEEKQFEQMIRQFKAGINTF